MIGSPRPGDPVTQAGDMLRHIFIHGIGNQTVLRTQNNINVIWLCLCMPNVIQMKCEF